MKSSQILPYIKIHLLPLVVIRTFNRSMGMDSDPDGVQKTMP